MTDAELLPFFFTWSVLATSIGGASFLALRLRPTRVKVERYPEIPVELSRLAKAFGITEDVDSSKSYGRMIHDYIEGLKADHDTERRGLRDHIEVLEAKVKANREALKADVEVSLKRLSGIRGTYTLNGSSLPGGIYATSADGVGLRPGSVAIYADTGGGLQSSTYTGDGYVQRVDNVGNTETWEYAAGPDGKPWSMTGPVGFVPHGVGVAFAKSRDIIAVEPLSPGQTLEPAWIRPTGEVYLSAPGGDRYCGWKVGTSTYRAIASWLYRVPA